MKLPAFVALAATVVTGCASSAGTSLPSIEEADRLLYEHSQRQHCDAAKAIGDKHGIDVRCGFARASSNSLPRTPNPDGTTPSAPKP